MSHGPETDCIFCKIVRREINSPLLHEDQDLIAFNDIRPAMPMHLLIVPKRHVATLSDVTDGALLGAMQLLAVRLATLHGCGVFWRDGVAHGGYKTQFNVGPAGGQEVYHLHLHVMGTPHSQ